MPLVRIDIKRNPDASYAKKLSKANAGRMDATPVAGDSTQALETWHDDVSGIESAWRLGNGCAASGWKFTQLVA